MPRQEQEQAADEVEKDPETGLMVRGDPFGGTQKDLVGVADMTEWEVLEEDFGSEIDWSITPEVAGRLVAFKTVPIDHEDERGVVDTSFYGIENAVTGERQAFWGNYQIDKALQRDKYLGRLIYVQHKGKRDQSGKARAINVFNILVKREEI